MGILRPSAPRERGSAAEEHACRYLQRHGLRLIERNFRCRRGEVDLIMLDAGNLVFVEVRYRRQSRYGSGLESVDRRKQHRITLCAAQYLQRHPLHAGNLVFVEVRYRRQSRYGSGLESVDRRKQHRITLCAAQYLQQHPLHARRPARFDVVAVGPDGGIEWIRNAFDAA